MPFSKNINTYDDVLRVLRTARDNGGARYVLASAGSAVMWRSRAYNFRKLLTNIARARAGNIPGFMPTTEWDDILLTVEGKTVKIEFGRLVGKLFAPDGTEVTPPALPHDMGQAENIITSTPQPKAQPKGDELVGLDDLESSARALRKRLGLDEE